MLTLLVSCGRTTVPTPRVAAPNAAQEPVSPITALHARPAALPELVPPAPSKAARWLPGRWLWRGSSWVWERGGWIENPDRLRRIPSRTVFTADGSLLFFDESWITQDGAPAHPPAISVPAATPPTPTLSEHATVP